MGPKTPDISGEKTLILLPAFDEMLVSYRDRGPSLSKANYKKVISSNGTFSPTIFQNGQVIGTCFSEPSASAKVLRRPSGSGVQPL